MVRILVKQLSCLLLASGFALASPSVNTCHYDETLTIDVWTSYAPAYAVNDFKKYVRTKYHKNVDVLVHKVLTPEDFFDRVRAGITDVISPSHNFLKDERAHFIKNRMVIPIDRKLVSNLQNVDPRFTDSDFVVSEGQLYGVPIAAGGYSLLYNKDHFKSAPKSWNILWDEQYKNRYAISKDFYEANIYITLLALGFSLEQMNNIKLIDTPKFREKLKYLLQYAQYWDGAPTDRDVEKLVLTTAWGISHSVDSDLEKKWLMAFPEEGVSMWGDYLAVTKNVERTPFAKTLAMEWLNYTIGLEFQKRRIVQEKRYLTPLKLSEADFKSIGDSEIKEIKYLSQYAHYWPILEARTRNRLKYIYEQVQKEIRLAPAPRK